MNSFSSKGVIQINDLLLWSHVGVLDSERALGQYFSLDVTFWLDLDLASKNDDLSFTVDYSVAIREIQEFSSTFSCLTIEHFSEKIMDLIESLYGAIPMKILLRKCNPPVPGFSGSISIERSRNY